MVVFHEDAIYPEYAIFYRRERGGAVVRPDRPALTTGATRSLAPPDASAGQSRSRSPSIDAPSKSPRPSSLRPVAPGSSRSRSVSPSPAPDLPGAISDPVAAEVQKKRARFAKAV